MAGVRARRSHALEAFVREFERLDRELAALGAEARSGPLRGPRFLEIPADLLLALAVEQDHRPALARRRRSAGGPLPMPVVEVAIVGESPLERDVRVLDHRRQLAVGDVLAAFAMLGDLDRGIEAGRFVESGADDAVELHEEVVVAIRVFAHGHGRLLCCGNSVWLLGFARFRADVPDTDA